MSAQERYSYPPKILLAQDDRLLRFLHEPVLEDWSAAVKEWCEQKETIIALKKQMYSSASPDILSATKTRVFSDEEFFSVTTQLESITAALTGSSVAHATLHHGDNEISFTSSTILDVFSLDPAMYSSPSLDVEHRRKCQEASDAYQKGDYSKAAEFFSSVIDSCLPSMLNAALVSNRAACYLRLENFRLSLRDATRSYEMDNQYVHGICQAVRSLLCSGKCTEARQTIEKFKKRDYSFESELMDISLYEKYSTFLERNEHAIALKNLNELLERVPCATFEVLKVQLLAIEEGNEVALAYVNKLLESYKDFPDLLYWRAQLSFLESSNKSDLEAVLPLCVLNVSTDCAARFRQVIQRIQQCVEMCTSMDSLVSKGEWTCLIELCSKALKVPFLGDRLRAEILSRRARGFYEMNRFYDCMDDIDASLRNVVISSKRVDLLLLKAQAEEKLLRWSDAIRDVELAMNENRTVEAVKLWRHLCDRKEEYQRRKEQKEQKERYNNKRGGGEEGGRAPGGSHDGGRNGFSQRQETGPGGKNKQEKRPAGRKMEPRLVAELYAHLALPPGASAERVKKSYRALAMKWHPDKWCGASDKERKEAEEMFKKVKAAYDDLMSVTGD